MNDLGQNEEMLKQYTMVEYYNLQYKLVDGKHISVDKLSTFNLQCFCDGLVEKRGYSEAKSAAFEVNLRRREGKGTEV